MTDYSTPHRPAMLVRCIVLLLLLPASLLQAEEEVTGTELRAADSEVIQHNAFPLPPDDVDVVGKIRMVSARSEDTLMDIGRQYGIGLEAMRMANPGVDLWLPGEGTEVVVPSRFILPSGPREGVVINLPEMRLYYFPASGPGEQRMVETYAVSIGRLDWSTPIGTTKVTNRLEQPAWFPPASVRAAYEAEGRTLPRRIDPGPENPLGEYAIGLGIPGYFIHGTNRPLGVGMRASAGCIRMFPEDIESLVHRLPVGTPVRIMNEPYKAGWYAGQLYIQAHPVLEEHRNEDVATYANAVRAVAQALDNRPGRVSYERLKAAVNVRNGLLVNITRRAIQETNLVNAR